jgi:hypothetical protein
MYIPNVVRTIRFINLVCCGIISYFRFECTFFVFNVCVLRFNITSFKYSIHK